LRIMKGLFVTGLSLLLVMTSAGLAFAQDEEAFIRRSIISQKDAIILSVIYPGLGQMTAGQKYKGITFFLGETISLLFAINAHENYNTKQKVYTKDLNEFNKIATKGSGLYNDALVQYKDLKDRNDELNNLNSTRNIALIAAVAVYTYNIVDAVFFSPSASEGQKAENNSERFIVRSTLIDRNPGILLSKSF